MWLVLCPSRDASALWAYQGLLARGLTPLEVVTAEELGYGVRWEHRLGADGVSIEMTLADGRRICSDTIHGVLNRLAWVPTEHVILMHPDDRDYVTQELLAFFASWLHALPQPVLNRPTPQGLAGQWRHVSEWVWLASKAGLPTADYKLSTSDAFAEGGLEGKGISVGTPVTTVLVVEGHVVGARPPLKVVTGCQRLGELARTELLGIEFAATPVARWTFAGATSLPDLRIGGEALLDVLTSILKGEGLDEK